VRWDIDPHKYWYLERGGMGGNPGRTSGFAVENAIGATFVGDPRPTRLGEFDHVLSTGRPILTPCCIPKGQCASLTPVALILITSCVAEVLLGVLIVAAKAGGALWLAGVPDWPAQLCVCAEVSPTT
jgi:hypothetical protein